MEGLHNRKKETQNQEDEAEFLDEEGKSFFISDKVCKAYTTPCRTRETFGAIARTEQYGQLEYSGMDFFFRVNHA